MAIILVLSLVAAAIGSGLVAGTFFAFSTFVMPAFSRIPTEQGIAAMNSINVTILRSPFMMLFVPTAILCLLIGVLAVVSWREGASLWMLAGAIIYIVASFASTIIFNVPMNDALAVADPSTTAGTTVWTDYLSRWTMWNHVRTAAGMLASLSFILALR